MIPVSLQVMNSFLAGATFLWMRQLWQKWWPKPLQPHLLVSIFSETQFGGAFHGTPAKRSEVFVRYTDDACAALHEAGITAVQLTSLERQLIDVVFEQRLKSTLRLVGTP